MKIKLVLCAAVAVLMNLCTTACAAENAPQNFLYTGDGDLAGLQRILQRPDIGGAQVVYSWKSLEPQEGVYDFSAIERDLAATDALGKKLFIQIQDRFFEVRARNIPTYLQTGKYGGGLVAQIDNAGEGQPVGYGWVALQWNGPLRARYQALLAALAKAFDGRVYGINLPETAIDIDMKHDATGFSCDAYFDAEMANLAAARAAFAKSRVVQYVNFWPCEWENDHQYMSRLFAYAQKNGVGLGGPDVIPWRKGQMKNAYPFFNRVKGRLALVAMAVQEPTLTYKNPKTGKRFTRDELVGFARDYLGADIIFWSAESPWLKE
jgi:hypothetical protein